MGAYKKFYETTIWREANNLQKELFFLTKNFPKTEIHALINQINRSTNSICANIAESHGRFYYLDKIRVLYIVRGELEETQSHLIVACSRGYITKEVSTSFIKRYELLKMDLNKYINTLYNQKDNKN